jgi:hypothetical protein
MLMHLIVLLIGGSEQARSKDHDHDHDHEHEANSPACLQDREGLASFAIQIQQDAFPRIGLVQRILE